MDIAAAIESAIGTLEVSLREQQLDLWSHATAAVEAPACADDHLVCAVCLDRLYCSFISFFHPFLTPASPFPPSHATPRVLPLPRPLRTLGCPGQVTPPFSPPFLTLRPQLPRTACISRCLCALLAAAAAGNVPSLQVTPRSRKLPHILCTHF